MSASDLPIQKIVCTLRTYEQSCHLFMYSYGATNVMRNLNEMSNLEIADPAAWHQGVCTETQLTITFFLCAACVHPFRMSEENVSSPFTFTNFVSTEVDKDSFGMRTSSS